MDEKLVYINKLTSDINNVYEYEFLFSESPEYVWASDWNVYNPSSCRDTYPDTSMISNVYKAKITYPLKTIQETNSLSIEYSTFNITALAWIDITDLETYPENGRMVFNFGDTKEKVIELLSLYDFKFETN